MKQSSACALVAAVLLGTGCAGSLRPVYLDKDVFMNKALVGNWRNDSTGERAVVTWRNDKSYSVAFPDSNGQTGRFIGTLARMRGRLIFDLVPEPQMGAKSGLYQTMLQPLHTFFFIEGAAPRARVSGLDPDSLDAYLKANPTSLAHVRTDDDRVVITAAPAAMQAFFSRYAVRPSLLAPPQAWVKAGP